MIELTPEQKRAAEATGSVAVTAGAGTGKTRMLAERYLHHVRQHNLSPLSVVAVTFTEKAAAELRSRIRTTLRQHVTDEKVIAEVEAAQISTIHALAARICRDFYDIAGLSADFAVLDETESPLWFGEKFAEAVARVPLEIADAIGHRKLIWLLQELLNDPLTSEKALAHHPDTWPTLIAKAQEEAKETLLGSDEWRDVCRAIAECSGVAGDKLEEVRLVLSGLVLQDRNNIDIGALRAALKGVSARYGSAKNWDAEMLDRLRTCIVAFKKRVDAVSEICELTFGPVDDELAVRLPLLTRAFTEVRRYIKDQKMKEKVLDFNDLEYFALRILEHEEPIRYYGQRWKAFLIDEFQDTNPVQAEIIGRLTSNGATVSVVGDEKQSIYGFRGADVAVFGRIREEIVSGKGESISLDRTFRAHQKLVTVMNTIFRPVLGDLHQELDANSDRTHHAQPFIRFASVGEQRGTTEQGRRVLEARYIADRIRELHDEGVPYSEMAILCRRWEPLNTYLDVLSAQNIPAINAGGGSLLSTIEARDVYSMLQFASDPHDDIALVSLLRSPFFAFNDKVLYEAARSKADEQSWWDLIRGTPPFAHAVETLEEILETAKTRSAETIIRHADKLTGYSAVTANLPQGPRRLADLEGVFDVLRKLALRGRGDVYGTVRYIRELYKNDIALPRPAVDPGEAVILMTIHRAKGLEWPVVFVPDLASAAGGGPSQTLIDPDLGVAFRIDDDENRSAEPVIYGLIKARRKARELEEARRILYVAITRAGHKVYLTAGKEKGHDVDLLRPGIDAAELERESIPYLEELTIAPAPKVPLTLDTPDLIDPEPLVIGLTDLPVTALTVFARCPAQFRWQYVEGHPGIADGTTAAMRVGSLTHLALEHDLNSATDLRPFDAEAADEDLDRAIDLANAFRQNAAYSAVHGPEMQRERQFIKAFGPVTLRGTADLVGEDFVLDYKTDAIADPAEHRFQIWAYASAFGKPRAYIAYLAHDRLYEFTTHELTDLEREATGLLERIAKGDYEPTPSLKACQYCSYRQLCEFRYSENNIDGE